MFGHQDDQSAHQDAPQQDTNDAPDTSINAAVKPADPDSEQPSGEPPKPDQPEDGNTVVQPGSAEPTAAAAAAASSSDGQATDWQHPGTPLNDGDAKDNQPPEPIADIISPAGGFPKRPSYQYPSAADADDADSSDTDSDIEAETPEAPENPDDTPDIPDTPVVADTEDDGTTQELVDIKQHALTDLAPIIDKLDLPPEEKFRTIMMMVQANDDENLIKAAYTVANEIEDEAVRAQALLGIINEVNYFTQPHDETQNDPEA